VINNFSDETQSYNKSVDSYLNSISAKFDDQNIKSVVKNLIQSTMTLKESGKKLSQKLEESTNEIATLKKDLEQVTVESQRDFLTGAFNRKTFEKYADEQLAAAKQVGGAVCLLMIDIDHFKRFNDRYGHLIGDEVLKTVAKTLINSLKGQDMVARFGGEEFVVILPQTPIEGAKKIAEMVRTTIATKELKRKDTGESYGAITVSMGISLFKPEVDNLLTMIKRADEALYESKKNGRNRVTVEA
jgi:diguanylate cyclase